MNPCICRRCEKDWHIRFFSIISSYGGFFCQVGENIEIKMPDIFKLCELNRKNIQSIQDIYSNYHLIIKDKITNEEIDKVLRSFDMKRCPYYVEHKLSEWNSK